MTAPRLDWAVLHREGDQFAVVGRVLYSDALGAVVGFLVGDEAHHPAMYPWAMVNSLHPSKASADHQLLTLQAMLGVSNDDLDSAVASLLASERERQ
jgi:hypothetical protein